MNAQKNKRTAPSEQSMPALLARALTKATLAGICTVVLLSLVCALIALLCDHPDALIRPMALASLALGSLVSGWVSRRTCRLSPMLCGGLGALALVLIGLLVCCFVPADLHGTFSSGLAWAIRGGVVLFCWLGASMGANQPKSKRRPRRRPA